MLYILDLKTGYVDPRKFQFCGQFKFTLMSQKEHPQSIVCEKCTPIGSHVVFTQDSPGQIHLVEIAIYALPLQF